MDVSSSPKKLSLLRDDINDGNTDNSTANATTTNNNASATNNSGSVNKSAANVDDSAANSVARPLTISAVCHLVRLTLIHDCAGRNVPLLDTTLSALRADVTMHPAGSSNSGSSSFASAGDAAQSDGTSSTRRAAHASESSSDDETGEKTDADESSSVATMRDARVVAALELLLVAEYYNARLSTWEPLIEQWATRTTIEQDANLS